MHHSWSHLFYLSSSNIMHHPRLPFPDLLTSFLSLFQSHRLKNSLGFTDTHTYTHLFVTAVLSPQDRTGGLAFSKQHPPVWCMSEARAILQRPQRTLECQEEARRSFSTRILCLHKAHSRSNNSITKSGEEAAPRKSIPAYKAILGGCEVAQAG